MNPHHLTVDLDDYDPSDPDSVRRALDTIKSEHGVSETAAYAILIRAAARAWSPTRPAPTGSPSPAGPSEQNARRGFLHVPAQRSK